MSPQSKAEPPNTTQEFPALDLTGLFDHSTPWHHADDEQIDFHLDQLEYASDLEDGHRLGQHEHSHQGLGSEYHSDTIAMALRSTDDQTNSPSTPAGEDPLVKTDDPGIAHDMSTHGQNAFDHLQYQMQNTQHTNDTGSEPKQEASLDTLTTSSNQQSSSVLNSDDIITSQAMHRHHTDPTPAANSIPPWQLYWPKERNQMASGVPERLKQPSGNRQKAATTPTSYPRQWQTQHSYAPTLPPSAPSYHVPATASQGNMSYHSHASPAHSSFGMNPYDPTMALNAAGYPTSLDNNNHHNSFANQHKTKRATPGMVRPSNVHHSPNLTQDHHHMLSVPQQFVLKSHVHDPNDIDVNTFTGMSQLHAAAMKQSPQGEMSELDNGFYEELEPDDELHYDSIEAARVAERQPARVNPKKDETIPWTNDQKRELVRRMVRCMSSVRFAQDNDGMIRQWAKLKLDEARVEQAAWRILVGGCMS